MSALDEAAAVGAASDTAAAPRTARTAFSAAHSAHATLASQTTTASQLHLLSSNVHHTHGGGGGGGDAEARTAPLDPSAAVASPSTGTDAAGLSRHQFHALISRIRQAATDFARSSPALRPSPLDHAQAPSQPSQLLQPPTSSEASASSNAVRRYVSLLGETSKHMAELRHSIDSFSPLHTPAESSRSVQSRIASVAGPSLASVRDAAAKQVATDPAAASAAMDALCGALDAHARALGLETFAEKAEQPLPQQQSDGQSAPASSEMLVHTLTIGAKILVIDAELAWLRGAGTEGLLSPVVRLKLSYATDSAHNGADGASPHRDPALAILLQKDVQAAADLVFGAGSGGRSPTASAQLIAGIAGHFASFASNLETLVQLDAVAARVHEAIPGPEVDVFDAMQRLSLQVKRLADAEQEDAVAAMDMQPDAAAVFNRLLERGHGLSSLHRDAPFLQLVFARDETSGLDYRLSLTARPLDIATDAAPSEQRTQCSWTVGGSKAASTYQDILHEEDPARKLGHVNAGTATVPLRFVAQLDPPVVVTRQTASKLARICGLPSSSKASTAASGTSAPLDGAIWFEDVLASVWAQRPNAEARGDDYHPRCTFTLARTPESLRDSKSQGLIVDALPLISATGTADAMDFDGAAAASTKTVTRLLAAIETLRDEVRMTELAHRALAGSKDEASDASASAAPQELSLDELLGGAAQTATPETIPVVVSWRGAVSSAEGGGAEAVSQPAPQPLVMILGFTVRATSNDGAACSHLDLEVSIQPTTTASPSPTDADWTVEAVATLRSDAGKTQTKRLDAQDAEAQPLAAELSRQTTAAGSPASGGLEALDRTVLAAVAWAETELGVRAQVPQREVVAPPSAFDPLAYEEKNVHAVYETIAPHFSSTRYKPWPLIPLFLSTIPAGSIGADLGCGNGKYLPLRSTLAARASGEDKETRSLVTLGVDRSSNLLSLARTNFPTAATDGGSAANSTEERGPAQRLHEVAIGDAMMSGLRTGVFDYAISIATIHHFSTQERRIKAVQELIRLVQPVSASPLSSTAAPCASSEEGEKEEQGDLSRLKGGHGRGRFMIFAWALEQKDEGKRQFEGISSSNRTTTGVDGGGEGGGEGGRNERLVSDSGVGVHTKREEEGKGEGEGSKDEQDLLVPWVLTQPKVKTKSKPGGRKKGKTSKGGEEELQKGMDELRVDDKAGFGREGAAEGEKPAEPPVYQRYYHVFRSGELEALVEAAGRGMAMVHRRPNDGQLGRVRVVCEVSGWERGNWWGVWRVEWC